MNEDRIAEAIVSGHNLDLNLNQNSGLIAGDGEVKIDGGQNGIIDPHTQTTVKPINVDDPKNDMTAPPARPRARTSRLTEPALATPASWSRRIRSRLRTTPKSTPAPG